MAAKNVWNLTTGLNDGNDLSSTTRLLCGIPQGSVLGPVLFILYAVDLIPLIERHNLLPHLCADDTQVSGSCHLRDVDTLASKVTEYEVAGWMRSNKHRRLKYCTGCATGRRQHQLPTSALLVDGVMVDPVTSVRDLGIFIDADLVMRTHVQRTVSRCFYVLRQLRQIRHLVPPATLQTVVVTLVLPRLDYGNGMLISLPAYLIRRLQSVLNASARLMCHLRPSDHITDALARIHWLGASVWIQFKMAVLTYKVLHGTAPRYTWVRLLVWLTFLVDVVSVQPTLIFWLYHRTNCLQVATDSLRLSLLKRGTVYRRTWHHRQPYQIFSAVLKLIYFVSHSQMFSCNKL